MEDPHCSFRPDPLTNMAVSEEKIKKNRPIRNKNCLWWPCLLTDKNDISNRNRGLSIDASYQVSVIWLPQASLVSYWSISKTAFPLKPLGQMI
jgi:hypothetical protein